MIVLNSSFSYRIDDLHIIGKGNERLVFSHPEDHRKVIKIVHNHDKSRFQNEIESLYFEHLNRKNIDCPHIPKYFGKLETERGLALVFEKIVNFDGTKAFQIDELIRKRLLSPSAIKENLRQLFWSLFKNNIVFADISQKNLVCRREEDGGFSFIIIDGIGSRHKSFKLWMYMHVGVYAKYKIYKQFARLSKKIDSLIVNQPH